jgi:hypothetical protein
MQPSRSLGRPVSSSSPSVLPDVWIVVPGGQPSLFAAVVVGVVTGVVGWVVVCGGGAVVVVFVVAGGGPFGAVLRSE